MTLSRDHWNRIKAGATERVRHALHQSLRTLGLDIHELGAVGRSLPLVLDHIQQTSWRPRTVIDVGVAYGTFELYDAFPSAYLLLIEPVAEWHPQLSRSLRNRPHDIVAAAAWDTEGSLDITIHGDPSASSVLEDVARKNDPSRKRKVTAQTLDQIASERNLATPILLKIDTQGTEYNVLAGAHSVLEVADVVLLEVSLIDNYTDGCLFDSIYILLREYGYRLFDIFGGNASGKGRILNQVDLAFVRAGTPLGAAMLGRKDLL